MKNYSSSYIKYREEIERLHRKMAEEYFNRYASLYPSKSQIQLEAEKGLIIEGQVNDQAHRSR